jgi:hypothetical protein
MNGVMRQAKGQGQGQLQSHLETDEIDRKREATVLAFSSVIMRCGMGNGNVAGVEKRE